MDRQKTRFKTQVCKLGFSWGSFGIGTQNTGMSFIVPMLLRNDFGLALFTYINFFNSTFKSFNCWHLNIHLTWITTTQNWANFIYRWLNYYIKQRLSSANLKVRFNVSLFHPERSQPKFFQIIFHVIFHQLPSWIL